MLPFHGRWRNAPKRAPEQEARLLMFAKAVNTSQNADDDDDESDILPDEVPDVMAPFDMPSDAEMQLLSNDDKQAVLQRYQAWKARKELMDEGNAQKAAKRKKRIRQKRNAEKAETTGYEERREKLHREVLEEQRTIDKEREMNRLKAISILNPNEVSEGDIKSYDVIASASQLQDNLGLMEQQIQNVQDNIERSKKLNDKKADKRFGGQSIETQIGGFKTEIEKYKEDINRRLFPLKEVELDRWEQGQMTPGEFIKKFEKFAGEMDALDEMDGDMEESMRNERKAARAQLVEDAKRKIAEVDAKMKLDGHTLEERWKFAPQKEKAQLIKEITAASQFEAYLQDINDDVTAIETGIKEKDFIALIKQLDREVMDDIGMLENEHADPKVEQAKQNLQNSSFRKGSMNPAKAIQQYWNSLNQTFGIKWMTLGTLLKSFEELKESIKEVKKRKKLEKIAAGTAHLGRMASFIPGLGGKDLLQVVEEQQEKKKSEIVEDYKKELGDNRNDFGYTDLFGKDGGSGRLREFAESGDTNRTRAVIEFAAGKGLLFNIEGADWKTYRFPGGYLIKDLVPHEWNNSQVESYFGNLELANNQGKVKSKKAGEEMVAGRGTADGYVEPFTGAINGLSIWFAQGIAEKAMSKVSDGEMSTRLTLAITEAWEHNKLFRENVPVEWLDRICGTGKQLVIGMTKYEKEAFVEGGKNGETDISKIKDKSDRGSQLGKLVVASRNYLFNKDPSLRAMYEDKEEGRKQFLLLQSRLLASQPVELPNGTIATIYSPALRPYQLQYGPDMMRDAPVADLGDDFFIKRSEIIRGNAALMKAVAATTTNGFAYPTKARYFFSHIIKAEEELVKYTKATGAGAEEQRREMKIALETFHGDIRKNLDQYIEYALASTGGGSEIILTEQHKDDGRPLFLTLAQKGMISIDLLERMAQKGGAAKTLLRSLAEHPATPEEIRKRVLASASLFGGQGKKKK